jgi:hypothetical protein
VQTPGSPAVGASPIGNFEQPVLAIGDPQSYGAVRSAIESSFSSSKVTGFLKSLASKDVRVRDFEGVLGKGLLGEKTRADYAALGNADQGQIREFYLASLEQVAPDVRQRFFKLYAYY